MASRALTPSSQPIQIATISHGKNARPLELIGGAARASSAHRAASSSPASGWRTRSPPPGEDRGLRQFLGVCSLLGPFCWGFGWSAWGHLLLFESRGVVGSAG